MRPSRRLPVSVTMVLVFANSSQRGALDGFYIAGVRHNVAFLGAVAASERFHAGTLSTDFIADMFPHGFAPPAEPTAVDRTLVVAALLAELKLRASESAINGPDREVEAPSELVWLPGVC